MSTLRFFSARSSGWMVLALVLGGCEGDSADLVRQINEAREGCTQERLKAGDEECIQMMERYAEMGTEAMQTYIGAVRALDQALQRLPPMPLDTAGLAHAITPSAAEPPAGGGSAGLAPQSPGYQRAAAQDPWAYPSQAPDGADPRAYRPAPGAAQPGRARPYPDQQRYSPDERYDPRHDEWARSYGPEGEPQFRDPRDRAPLMRPGQPRYAPSGTSVLPPQRGRMLPPSERLRRPDEHPDDYRGDYYWDERAPQRAYPYYDPYYDPYQEPMSTLDPRWRYDDPRAREWPQRRPMRYPSHR